MQIFHLCSKPPTIFIFLLFGLFCQSSIDMGKGKCKEIIGERARTNFTKIFKPWNGGAEMKLNHETCCSTYYQQVKELKYYAFYSIHYSKKYFKICNMVHIHKLNNKRGPQKNKKKYYYNESTSNSKLLLLTATGTSTPTKTPVTPTMGKTVAGKYK